MKNDGKTSSAPSLPQPSLASSTFDEEKQATLSTLAQVRESLRDKARLEELVSALTREKDALTKLFVPPPEGEQKESDALTDFQRVVDELAAFCRENSLEHLGKKTDKIITQFVQSAELSLGKVTSAAQPPSQPTASPSTPAPKDQKQQQQRLRKKTPTTQARRSAILLCGGGGGSSSSGANSNSPSGGGGNNNNLGKRFVINPPSSSRSVSASDSGSEGAGSVEQDVPSTPSQSKKKGKSKGSDTERVQSPFALSMALPGLSTTSQLKKKRSLCLTGVGGGDSGLMLQGSRRRSTVVGRSPLSDQTAALDKESVQKGCETMLKQIGVLEKICLLKKRTETKDAFDEGVQLVAESYDKISTVAKGYKAGFKLSEFNERRLRFIKAAKALFKKPGDEELKTEFSQADKELIDYVLTYTEELLAQIDVGDTMGRPKRSFCSSGGSASCGEDGGDASEMEYSILAADNETLNDELASREETISRLTERISALEQLNKEQCQVVEQLSRENAMLLERRIDAFAGDSKSAADELVAQLRSEAAVVAKSNAELTKTLEAMKAEEVRLGLLLKAEEAQRAELERECDRIYEASQQLCAAQNQQQNGKSGGGGGNGINSVLDKKSRRKSRRQCRGMSFAVDGLTAASSPQQQQQPSRAVMSSTTEKLIELLCSIVPGFSESWAQLSKDDVRVVDKAVRSLGKSGISGGGGNSNNNSSSSRGDSSSGNSRGDEPFSYAALVTGKALRAWPDAVWAWERAVYAAELGRKLAFHRKPPLTLRESTRRGELVSVAAELGARLGKAVGSMLLALSSKRALPHRRMTVCGSGPDIEYFESVGENNNSGVNDLKAYFAAEEIDNELIGVRTALMTLITRVRELAKETDVAGPEKPKVERVYDQIENDIRCLGVKGTPDANIIAQASGDSVALGVRAQLVRSLDEDSASANICASRIFAIVSAGYKYTRSYNGGGGGGPYGAMLWELSTTALRLAKVLSRISNCYETAVRIRVAATTVKPTLPPQETAATATVTTSSDNAFISVRQLVETLTPESSSRSKKQHSNNAVASALSMLHTYTTPSTLLACLIERYNNSNNSAGSNNNNNNKHKAQVQQGVLGVLRTWVSVFGGVDDIAEAGVSDALIHFLESVPPDAPVPAPDTFTSQAFTVPGTAQQLRRDVRHGLELRRRRAKALAVPRPRIPLCCEHRSPLELVFMADPTAVAEQLTLVTHTRVAAVRIGELAASAMSTKAVACACAWARPEAQAAVVRSGAGAFAERSALLEQLVGIVALAHGGVEQRAVMLGRLVHVMMHLQKLHNYNDLMCLYAGFRSAPVMQLARTAALMSQEALRGLAVLDRLFAPDGDYKAYRRELEKVAAAADPAEPFIPAFAVVARDVAALNERYPDPPAHGLVSLARCSAFLGCVAPILKCQSRSYRFIVSDPLYSALAELPACTEATLFSLSSLYEPRRHVGFTGV